MGAMTWSQAFELYYTALRAAGRQPGTIHLAFHYLTMLRDLFPWPWLVETGDLQTVLARANWSPETRKSARTAFRGFYRWGFGAGYTDDDPASRLDPVRVPRGRPRPTPEHLVAQLLRHPDARIGLMAMLAAYGGLRCAEIAQVHARDLVDDELIVQGKGGKVRAIPIVNDKLHARLRLLDGWAFPNGQGGHLSPGHVSRLISRELPDGWTAHTLRHRCGTVAYAATRDLLAVSALLGHSRPETTQRYVLMPNDAIRAAVQAASA